jgi:hypothetical protein
MTTALVLRLVAIGAGILVFIAGEFVEQANQRKPPAEGRRRMDQFNRDAGVFTLRLAGAMIVVVTLILWEFANRSPSH